MRIAAKASATLLAAFCMMEHDSVSMAWYNLDMQVNLSPEQRDALAHAGASPVLQLVDPETNEAYVLIRAHVFERLRQLLSDDDFDVRQAYPLMDAAARVAGWDHPDEDIYDDLDPRRQP